MGEVGGECTKLYSRMLRNRAACNSLRDGRVSGEREAEIHSDTRWMNIC